MFITSEKQIAAGSQKASYTSLGTQNKSLKPAPSGVEGVVQSSPVPKMVIENQSSNPIQRRINDALGIAAVA